MARRGFIAEINRQIKLEQQRQARAQREAERQHRAAVREAERARREEERAAMALQRAQEAERKRLEKEAREAHLGAMEAEAARLNAELASTYADIDGLLAATLDVDDYVDLETLRAVVEHPPFDRPDLRAPAREPEARADPEEPARPSPTPPGWYRPFALRKHRERVAAHRRWTADVAHNKREREAALASWKRAEAERAAALEAELARYRAECEAREAEAADRNGALDRLIANLGYGAPDAVEEYVSIVLSNSVYPPSFHVDHEFTFEVETAELSMRALVPAPDTIPAVKAYRYQKSTDEIVSSDLSAKARRERYAGALHQVALRSLHEVFEADRRGIVKTIRLQVSTATINPATGGNEIFCLVAVGAERESFLEIKLENVVPEATLSHLGAVVSKNPAELVAVDASGIRRS